MAVDTRSTDVAESSFLRMCCTGRILAQMMVLVATFTAGYCMGMAEMSPLSALPSASNMASMQSLSWCQCPTVAPECTTTLQNSKPIPPKSATTPKPLYGTTASPSSNLRPAAGGLSTTSAVPPATSVTLTTAATTTVATTRAAVEQVVTTVVSTTALPRPASNQAAAEPTMVKVFAGGNGRLGNNIGQLLHGLMFATLIHADKVELNAEGGQLKQVFKVRKTVLDLPVSGNERGTIPKECKSAADASKQRGKQGLYASGFWTTRCDRVKAREYHDLALEHIWPLLQPPVKACLEDVAEPGAEKQLTVHLRGNDLWDMGEFEEKPKHSIDLNRGAHHWLWAQPPCSMFEKIVREEGYTSILVVTSPDKHHACVPWFEEMKERTGLNVKVIIQAKKLAEDFCALAKAENLVLSFSTLSNAAAIMSKRLRRVYVREFALNSLMNCNVWGDVTLTQYSMPISEGNHKPYNNTYAGVIEWFQTYPASEINKKTACK
eukprot:TRINITY_DN27433_c0_g1_i1.p1 TRINITY_DN27433_c0_g1~~TRINITY_DN27433_c0_g1_i1.p1  ORF type:complete len:503 (-),score=62.19 TRINITY_DN27433_c0_g1_i1:14-1489(-)